MAAGRIGRAVQKLKLAVVGAILKGTAGETLADQIFRLGLDRGIAEPFSLVSPFNEHPTVHRAVRAKSTNVSRVPLLFYKGAAEEPVPDTPVEKLLNAPNDMMRGTQLIEATVDDLELVGNSIWWYGPPGRVDLAGAALPAWIRLLPLKRTKPKLGDGDLLIGYEVQTSTGPKLIPVEEVSHFKRWNPDDETWGSGWGGAARDEYETDYLAQTHNKRFFRRGADPGTVLQPKDASNVTAPQRHALREEWLRESGLPFAHVPRVLPVGFELQRFGIGQRDMDFVNQRRLARENTLSASGIPPAIAGILEYANYANMLPQLRLFFELEVLPLMTYLEAVIQADLLDRFKTGLRCRFNRESISSLIEDMDSKSQIAERLWKCGVPMTVLNDRLELGLELDGVEGADEPHVGTPVAGEAPPAAPPGPKQPAPPADAEGDIVEEDSAGTIVFPRRGARDEAAWRATMAAVRDLELKSESRWRTHLAMLRAEVLRHLGALRRGELSGPRSRAQHHEDPGGPKGVDVFNLDNANQEAVITLEPIWRAAMQRGADTVDRETGRDIEISFVDPRVSKLLAARRQEIRDVNERMLAQLHDELRDGVEAGETEEELRKRVLDFFAGERSNARTIARTETFAAFSEGRYEGMREARVKRHRWVTARDDRVRDSHEAQEGDVVTIGTPFKNGLRYPHDPTGPADEVINCRCITVPIVA